MRKAEREKRKKAERTGGAREYRAAEYRRELKYDRTFLIAVQKLTKDIDRAFDVYIARISRWNYTLPSERFIATIFQSARAGHRNTTTDSGESTVALVHHCGLSQSAKCHMLVSKRLLAEIPGTQIKSSSVQVFQ